MIMAAGTFESQSQKSRAESVDAVGDVFTAPFFFDAAAFIGLAMEPVESGGQALGTSGISQQVTGKLLGQELVIGQITLEGIDDPVAIRPSRTELIALIAVAVGIASGIEPRHGHSFAEMVRSQEAIGNLFISTGGFVGRKRLYLLWRWRQTD